MESTDLVDTPVPHWSSTGEAQGAPCVRVTMALAVAAAALAVAIGVAGCGGDKKSLAPSVTSNTVAAESSLPSVPAGALPVEYSPTDLDDRWDRSQASLIIFNDGTARFEGAGARVQGSVVTIESPGIYVVSGATTEGQVLVDLQQDDVVNLVLDGVELASTTSAPICVENADKVVITLTERTDNIVTWRTSATSETLASDTADADAPDAAIFSRSDLTFNGAGSLTVTAEQAHGISSKDDLKIVSGTIVVRAARDGLKGRDCIGIRSGSIAVDSGSDGLQSNNATDPDRGQIAVSGGNLQVTAAGDGIQAQNTLLVLAGEIRLNTGGGSAAGAIPETQDLSAKGLKSSVGVYVAGGTLNIDSRDDAINANGSIQIDGGAVTASTADDGLHADDSITVNGGTIAVTKAWEGFESSVITINDGTIEVVADDDAFNAVTVRVATLIAPGAPKWSAPPDDSELHINGGYLTLAAYGDGLDSNGSMYMTGGTVIVTGAPQGMNVAVDYNTEFVATGGLLVGVGPSQLAEAPGATSTQNSILVKFDQVQAAGTLVHVASSTGETLLTFEPSRQYQSLVFSSPDIGTGATYDLYLGGSSTGTETNGLYSDGVYSGGTLYTSLTIERVTTTYGSGGGRGPGGH